MSDAPSIEEELERKTSETLASALQGLSRGVMSKEACKAALQALWDATSGLVSRELMDLIAESIDAIETTRDAPRRVVLAKADKAAIIDLPEAGRITARAVQFFKCGSDKDVAIVPEGSGASLTEAARKTQKVVRSLKLKGYREL